jgi:hypothetical protein
MTALLFVLLLVIGPSEMVARVWVTALIVGIILIMVYDMEDLGTYFRNLARRRPRYYDRYPRFKSERDKWKRKRDYEYV